MKLTEFRNIICLSIIIFVQNSKNIFLRRNVVNKKYHLIANAHLDPVWQWRVPEGLSLVKSTFRSALDRMNEFPDYTFTSACASYYKWIKISEPEMFEEIKQRVKAGIENYIYMRPDNRSEKPNLPFESLHLWQSPDGSIVNCFHIPDGYSGDVHEARLIDQYYNKEQPMMVFFGVGNHGGGPFKEHLANAEALVAKDDFKYSVLDEYFEETSDVPKPLLSEDLQHHASGCYSANSRIKEQNRHAEAE